MSRMKWNLDLLEEVEKQHEKALISTEQVVDKVRSDLYSMTEDVWEGEDADMARDQLQELSFKEMPDTYDQIDTCDNVIQKAQKEAYESKNFCNGFPQIFRSASMPSEGDSSKCTGDLMCDSDSCEGLKGSMKAAGQNARNVRSAISSVESILASLETDFAKFDYTSYTQPIKDQTQKVAERTEMYNTAVTRYEHKTKELDHTLSNALEAATPSVVPAPLDPSCLGLGDQIHFRGREIIGDLSKYDRVELDGDLDDAQIEDILSMLFDKEHVDISEYSEEDFGMAFIKLSEEKKRAMLMEMGYNKEQIDSILDSLKGKNAKSVGNSVGRTLIDEITNKGGKKYGGLGKAGSASTLGLAGIRPGRFNADDYAKTSAEAYDATTAGGSKTKTGGNTGKNSGSSSTGSNPNPGGTSTTSSGNGIETTPEEVQEWVESGDTASMNAYIEETSQNVDEWDSNRAANLGTIYEWSLQSGNTEVAEKFANHFRIEVSVTDGENSDTHIHTYAMNEEAMNAIINAIPSIYQNNYEDIDGTARETLEQLKQWEGTIKENKKTGTTTDLQNISVSLNEKYQMVFSYKKCSGDTVTITSDQSIVVDTPTYIVNYWLNNDDKEIVKAYIDATPKEVSDWEQERNYNLATIFDWAVNNQEMEVLECENKLFFSNDLIHRDIRWGTTCYRDNRTYSIVGHGSVIEAIRNALRYQNKTGSEAYEILGKFYEYATLPAEDLPTFAIEYTSSDQNADIDAWKPGSAGWYGSGYGIEYYYKNSITKDEFGNLIFQFGYKNGPYLNDSIIDGFKYVSEYLPADLKIEDIVDLSTGDIKPRYVHNFYVKDANKVPYSVYAVFESLLNRIGNASTDSVLYGGKTLSQLLNVDGLFKLADPDESQIMCKYTTSFSELVKRFYEHTIKDSKNSIFLTDCDLEEDEYIRATNTLTLALTLREIDSALQEFFGYAPDGVQPMRQDFSFEYSSDTNRANAKWEIWDITSNYYLGSFPTAIKVNAFGSKNSLGQQLNKLQDEYLESMKQSIPVTVGTNAEFWLIGLSDPCYCIPTTILSTLLSIAGNVDNNSKVETCICINDFSNAVDAIGLKGQIVTHYNSDGSVESFELTNLFYDEEELQNQVDAYNESLNQTQSRNQAITVEDLIESFTEKYFNPDATDEQIKDIDCYTEWYGQH